MLQLHARGCQQPECPVPRCRELREMRRRQIQRQEDARRSNYMQMMVRLTWHDPLHGRSAAMGMQVVTH